MRLLDRSAVILLLLFACSSQAGADAGRAWDPQRTWVFAVGVLEWQDAESFDPFPKEKRRDAELVTFFRGAGVPDAQIVYLQDRQATQARIDRELPRLLEGARPGDTLFVYYCGHGYRNDKGHTFFAPWDASSDRGWRAESIPSVVARHFKGARVVLLADCCYSGVLARAASEARGPSFATLTSSSASQLSTGNWTFTEAVLDALRGAGWVDLDGDGRIRMEEAGRNAVADMAFAEEQRATVAFSGGFEGHLAIAAAKPRRGRVGDRVHVRWKDGNLYAARVVGERGSRLHVDYFGWDDRYDEDVAGSQLEEHRPRRHATGTSVQVEWKATWWPARVLAVEDGVHLIRYDGYGPEWDEWVASSRIR